MSALTIAKKETGFEPEGFTMVQYQYFPREFGDIVETWEQGDFVLQYVKDRGQDWISWVPTNGDPIGLILIFNYLHIETPGSFNEQAIIAVENKDRITLLSQGRNLDPAFEKFLLEEGRKRRRNIKI